MKMDFPRVLGCFSSRCSSLSFTSSHANRVGVVPDHRWCGFHVACWKTEQSDCGRRIPGLSVLSVSSLLPAVAVQVEMERTHASHLLPISLLMGQAYKCNSGSLPNENQSCWVLAGAEGDSDLMFLTQLFPRSLPEHWVIPMSSWWLQEGLTASRWRIWIWMLMLVCWHQKAHRWRSPWHRSSLLFFSFRKEQLSHPINVWKPLSHYHENKRITVSLFFNETRAKDPMCFYSLFYFCNSASYVSVFGALFICVQTKRAC